MGNKSYGVFTTEQDNDKANVEHVHSYYPFHTRSDMSGVKGISEWDISINVSPWPISQRVSYS